MADRRSARPFGALSGPIDADARAAGEEARRATGITFPASRPPGLRTSSRGFAFLPNLCSMNYLRVLRVMWAGNGLFGRVRSR